MTILPSQRHLFDIPDTVSYLNCAYMSPLSRRVATAGTDGLEAKRQPWRMFPPDFFRLTQEGRAAFASLLASRATADDIAIVPAASYGMAVAAAAVSLKPGQRVLALADEFPSTILTWRDAAHRAGAEFVLLPRPANHDWATVVCEAIDDRTAVAALPHVHWIDGAVVDLARVRTSLNRVGAILALDLTQSLGTGPFDFDAVAPDFLVAASYKWLMGPYSIGFLYVAPRWQHSRPLEHHWFGRLGSENFSALTTYPEDFQPGARRFDMGEPANFALLPAAIAAIEQIKTWGVANIAETAGALTDQIVTRATEFGFTAVPNQYRARHYLGLRAPTPIPADLADQLARAQVFISIRGGDTLRITPHVYNTQADIDRLFDVLVPTLRP